MSWPRVDGLRTLELGDPGPLRRELTALVLAGRKTATTGLLADYDTEGEALEHVGERLALVGDDGEQLAVVRVTAVEVVPFAGVDDAFARAEGEGFTGREDWALAHRRYWRAHGSGVDDTTPVACVRFELLADRR